MNKLEVAVDGAEIDDDSEGYEGDAGPEGEARGVGREAGLGRGDLAEEEAEAAYGKADAHEAEAGADPGEEGSFGGEVDAGVLLGGLGRIGHGGIVRWFGVAGELVVDCGVSSADCGAFGGGLWNRFWWSCGVGSWWREGEDSRLTNNHILI